MKAIGRKTLGFLDGLRTLAEGFADIISFGEYSASKAREAVPLTQEQAYKADKDALAGDWMALAKDINKSFGTTTQFTCCPLCKRKIEVACKVGYCQECNAWITLSRYVS